MKAAVPLRAVLSVAVDILPKKGDLFVALISEMEGLFKNALRRTGDLFSPGMGDDALGAGFVAAPDDRDVGFDAVISFGDEVVEIFTKTAVYANGEGMALDKGV